MKLVTDSCHIDVRTPGGGVKSVPAFWHKLELGHDGSARGACCAAGGGLPHCAYPRPPVCHARLVCGLNSSWLLTLLRTLMRLQQTGRFWLLPCRCRLLEALRPAVRARADHGQDQAAPGGAGLDYEWAGLRPRGRARAGPRDLCPNGRQHGQPWKPDQAGCYRTWGKVPERRVGRCLPDHGTSSSPCLVEVLKPQYLPHVSLPSITTVPSITTAK